MKISKIALLLATLLFFAVCICGAFLLTKTMRDYKDSATQKTQEAPAPAPAGNE
ncbi:MAG: hypothetical protein IJJ26_07765 [Victivallales bacterium]|nr:hypothetical protein [Victivallales bacterium]